MSPTTCKGKRREPWVIFKSMTFSLSKSFLYGTLTSLIRILMLMRCKKRWSVAETYSILIITSLIPSSVPVLSLQIQNKSTWVKASWIWRQVRKYQKSFVTPLMTHWSNLWNQIQTIMLGFTALKCMWTLRSNKIRAQTQMSKLVQALDTFTLPLCLLAS